MSRLADKEEEHLFPERRESLARNGGGSLTWAKQDTGSGLIVVFNGVWISLLTTRLESKHCLLGLWENEAGSVAVVCDPAAERRQPRRRLLGGIIVWLRAAEKRWEKPGVRQEGGVQQHGAPSGVTPGLLPQQDRHTVSTQQMHSLINSPDWTTLFMSLKSVSH